MSAILTGLLPILTFIGLYCGSGLYFSYQGVEGAFYQISPLVCILPACILAIALSRKSLTQTIDSFITGLRDDNILIMCIIFLLAGAFSTVTKSMGCAQAAVGFITTHIPAVLWLPSLFLISAFIATSLGTSMGVIALITPIAVELATQNGLDLALTVGTVVGAAMFGDNLSMISDTTIASVMSQKASFREKFIINSRVAVTAGLITLGILVYHSLTYHHMTTQPLPHDLIKILPYLVLFTLGFCRVHVFVVLISSLIFAGILGAFYGYTPLTFAQDIASGFKDMHEIMVLSLLVGGIAQLARDQGVIEAIQTKLHQAIQRRKHQQRFAEFLLGGVAGIFDFLIANNTIAILLAAPFAQAMGKEFKVPAARRAYILDTFSCIMQGIIPHGAQILLAMKISGLSYMGLVPMIYYCGILAVVTVAEISLFARRK